MVDQKKDQEQPGQPTQADLYGSQGNQGQYGQGQYDSNGNPDSNGVQARQIAPEGQNPQRKKSNTTTQSPDPSEHNRSIPLD
ncbi:MAG: hypothetical protein NVS2B12_37780 [Ktedonobacteraceae bacterium]